MTDFAEKYINPFTDYGFKKLFGDEPNKDLLLDFLNQLLKDEQGGIKDLTIDELDTRFDKWLFVLKNLNKLERVPDKLKERIFEKLFETAEIAKFTPDQVRSYEDSLKYYRDLKNSLDTAKIEGKVEVAIEMIRANEPIDKIMKFTGLTQDQIDRLK